MAILFIRNAVKSLARKCGFQVSRISNMPFGRDVWVDIARLSERWGFSINCVFDVGANIGQTSLTVLAHFPNAEVYSFEPHPDTFQILAAGLKGRRAQAFNIALSDKSGKAELFTYEAEAINSLTPTEGCDLDVLKGATIALKSKKIRFVYTEFNDIFERAGRTGGALAPICGFLEPFGFRFVTCYTDTVVADGEFFAIPNVLFAACF